MSTSKFIAYAGEHYTIEWYYDRRGRSLVREYYNLSATTQKAKLEFLFRLLADTGKIHNKEKFRSEDDKIYAFKPKPDRFLCFFYRGKKIIVTNAFEKKTDKLSPQEKGKALVAMQEYIDRCNEGIYYEEKNQINK